MNNKCFIFILFCISSFLSCSKKSNEIDKNNYPTVKIDINKISSMDLAEIADFSSLIPLETTDKALIGEIKKAFFIDSLIVVWDSKMNNILLFNDKGDFKHTIGKRGSSSEEYIKVTDVCLTSQNRIQVLDNASRRILTYSLSGECIESVKLNYYLYSFFPAEDGIWGVNSYQNEKNYYLIHTSNASGKIDNGYFPNETKYILKQTNNFFKNEITKDLLFHYCYNDKVYKIEDDKLIPLVSIDFGDKKAPYNFSMTEDLEKKLNSIDYLGEIHDLYAHGDHLFFSFYGREASNSKLDIYNVYMSVQSHEVCIYSYDIKHSNILKVLPIPKIVNISDNKLIYQIIPEILSLDLCRKLQEMLPENKEVGVDSNPILVIYNLKS